MTSLEGFGCGAAELCCCRSMVSGPAREWPWIAAVYRPIGHVAGTPQVVWGVACRTGHDDLLTGGVLAFPRTARINFNDVRAAKP